VKDRQERLDRSLEELSKQHGILGVALVSRDGICVKALGHAEMNRETFCAMSATLMGAAEIALSEIDPSRATHVVAQTAQAKIIVMGATGDLLLIVHAAANAPLDAVVEQARAAATSIASVVAG
jgi:uncharacterized protein